MKNRQFFTLKFNSSRLKEFKYDIKLSFDQAKENNEVIALFENQMIRSIRDIHKRVIDYEYLESLHSQRDELRELPHSKQNSEELEDIQDKINQMLYIPEYVTIVMDHPSHYKHLYKEGLRLNGKVYRRLNSSASQARVSTVTFCEEKTGKKLTKIMDNGRNLNKEFVASKLNAYKGLAGSSTQVVSTPKFCLVPDYESETEARVNYVTETDWEDDDIMEETIITEAFERFDGQGLISYEKASEWAEELGLDYVPAQWCIRQNYLKGMLCTFDIHRFCEEKNNGNYRIKTSYNDENGDPIIVDLRDYDVITTESQFKLWDSFPSLEVYKENCIKNNLQWGVSLYTPKEDKDILTMNYQFLQTLNLDKDDIKTISEDFVEWVTGVNSENVYYTMLFLLGNNITQSYVEHYLKNGENNWIKALIVQPDMIHDNFIKQKVRELTRRRIEKACLGDIMVDGNFQVLVSDPFAMMQFVCGLEVTGLLGKKEYYSNYWNEKGVKTVDAMRSPLTYRSEHVILDMKDRGELDKWYNHSYTGIIVNVHGIETMHWGGSDWDYDIIATTSDTTIIHGVYEDELPIVYEPPESTSKVLTEDDLFNSDLFSFGSIIGSITNKSTSGYALLANLKEGTEEYETTLNRIRMSTKLQSAQIDKAKIGREVKGIPNAWVRYQKVRDDDSEKIREKKEFQNRVLLEKHPYFFIYAYSGTKRKYNQHVREYDTSSRQNFNMSLDELRSQKRNTKEQLDFLQLFERFSPVIDSDSVMNNISKYIESIDFQINEFAKTKGEVDYKSMLSIDFKGVDEDKYEKIKKLYELHRQTISKFLSISSRQIKTDADETKYYEIQGKYEQFKDELIEVCSNETELADLLVHLFYIEDNRYNKNIFWSLFGERVVENMKESHKNIIVPVQCEDGDFKYLKDTYRLERMDV